MKLLNTTLPEVCTHNPVIQIKPFVFLAQDKLNFNLSKNEVARVFEIEFSRLKECKGENRFEDIYETPILPIEEKNQKFRINLWGVTYRILSNLIAERNNYLEVLSQKNQIIPKNEIKL